MAIYTPERILMPNGLDELGHFYSLKRLQGESLSNYRLRLLDEARDPSGVTQDAFARTVSRQLGYLKKPLVEITLINDVNNIPLAANPYIQVFANKMVLYSDYRTLDLDMELDFTDRAVSYFIEDLVAEINTSTYFEATLLDADYANYRSNQLMIGSNLEQVESEILTDSRSNKLNHTFINDFFASAKNIFINEVDDIAYLVEAGNYYMDRLNGVVVSTDAASGFCNYTYYKIPFTLYYAPVRFWPFNDLSNDLRIKDVLISDETGEESKEILNSYGAEIINELLKIHPLGWGK